MGLGYDPNEVLKIPNSKKAYIDKVKLMVSGKDIQMEVDEVVRAKTHIADQLEAEATLPKPKMFKLPKGEVTFLTHLLDQYGEDYEVIIFPSITNCL